MSKRKLAIALLILLLYVGLAVGTFFLWGIVPVFIMAAILIFVMLAVFIINKLFLRWVSHDKPSSYFQDLSSRNMDAIVVGSTKAWKYTDFSKFKNKIYDCTSYQRSQLMNFAALKTYHSHVKTGGRVYFCFDYNEAVNLGAFISPIDYKYIHPHIFLALKKKQNSEISKYPILYYPKLVTGFVVDRFLKKIGFYKKRTWKIPSYKKTQDKALNILVDKLSQVVSFCVERDLNPVITVFVSSRDENIIDKINNGLKVRNVNATVISVNNACEWNDILKNDVK